MVKKEFYKLWAAKTFTKPLLFVDLLAGLLAVIFGAVVYFYPAWGGTMNVLLWAIPLGVAGVAILVGFIRAPYHIYKDQADKVREYETQAIDLQPNSMFESRRNIWVARVGVSAIGQKSVRGVVAYLRYIDGNENGLFDAPLRPAERLRNVTGAINVSPGKTQKFIEILHWNPAVPEMGIPYNLNYQLEQAGIDPHTSPYSLPTGIEVGTHTLIIYATGEDMKPVEAEFRVEIRSNKLEIDRIDNAA